MFLKFFPNHLHLIALVLHSVLEMNVGHLREPHDVSLWRNSLSRQGKQLSDPTVYRCGQIGKDLVVNFVNSKYPENDVNGGDCRFRLVISGPHICQVRVDFIDSDMTMPTRGDCLSQLLEVEGPVWPTGLPPLCGFNTDQHFYLHLEPWGANTSWVDFRVTTVVAGKPYRFGLWLTQIDCTTFNVLKAPEGCTQFYIGEKGVIKSFNFDGMQSLNSLNYRVCIKPEVGVCGVRYDAGPEEFRVRKSVMTSKEIQLKSGTGSNICALDYIMIPGGRDSLQAWNTRRSRLLFLRRPSRPNLIIVNNPTPSTSPTPTRNGSATNTGATELNKRTPGHVDLKPQWDRYCGGALAAHGGETVGKPVFARVRSNLISLNVRTAATQEKKSVRRNFYPNMRTGFRISYNQVKNCEDNETDLASPPNVAELIQSMNPEKAEFSLPLFTDQAESTVNKKTSLVAEENLESSEANSSLSADNSTKKSDESIWEYLDDQQDDEDSSELEDEFDLYDFK